MTGSAALAGVTLLELGDSVGGAYAGRLLAGFGARVIKVEHPSRPSPSRSQGPFRSIGEEYDGGAMGAFLNWGKESVTVAWDDPVGAHLVAILAEKTQAILETRPLVERMDSAVVPTITIDMFAEDDRFGVRDGSELLAQMLGNESLGYHQRPPLGTVPGDGYFIAGALAAVLVASALMPEFASEARRFAACVAVRDALLTLPTNHIVQPMFTSHFLPRPEGPQPMNVLPCEDGVVNIQTGLGWKRMVAMLGDPTLLDDERFNTFPARLQNIEALDALVGEWASKLTRDEIFECAARAEVPSGPLLTIEEVAGDPHFRARRALGEHDPERYPGMLMPNEPFRLSETPWAIDGLPPRRGEHLVPLFEEFVGLTPAEVARLRNLGVV